MRTCVVYVPTCLSASVIYVLTCLRVNVPINVPIFELGVPMCNEMIREISILYYVKNSTFILDVYV